MSDSEREEAIELAGALQIKVDDVYARNDALVAENESLKVAFDAVNGENVALRRELDLRTRQRDGAMRAADLLDEKMRKIQAISNEAMNAVHPARQERLPRGEPVAGQIAAPTTNGMAVPH